MPRPHLPSLRFAAIFSQQTSAIDWACQRAAQTWGEVVIQSADIDFDMTSYYDAAMGPGLKKRLVAFKNLVDPVELVSSKRQAIEWEKAFRHECEHSVERPLNIDPGYLTEAKVVLMTTKDRDHRLYMGEGIFAEITLFYQLPGKWISSRWTYPDFKRDDYHEFFFECREHLRKDLQQRLSSS